jgi:hypothetical protein
MTTPVVDHAKRAVIQEITSKSPFNIFNIIAVLAILMIGYFLYKKFTEKFQKGSINIPEIQPLQIRKPVMKAEATTVEVVAEQPEVIPEPGSKEE